MTLNQLELEKEAIEKAKRAFLKQYPAPQPLSMTAFEETFDLHLECYRSTRGLLEVDLRREGIPPSRVQQIGLIAPIVRDLNSKRFSLIRQAYPELMQVLTAKIEKDAQQGRFSGTDCLFTIAAEIGAEG